MNRPMTFSPARACHSAANRLTTPTGSRVQQPNIAATGNIRSANRSRRLLDETYLSCRSPSLTVSREVRLMHASTLFLDLFNASTSDAFGFRETTLRRLPDRFTADSALDRVAVTLTSETTTPFVCAGCGRATYRCITVRTGPVECRTKDRWTGSSTWQAFRSVVWQFLAPSEDPLVIEVPCCQPCADSSPPLPVHVDFGKRRMTFAAHPKFAESLAIADGNSF